jgi:Fe-S oxidoreductase
LKDLRKERSLHNKVLPGDKAEILLFVGCTASYDVDLRNVAPSIVGLLEAIGADYGVLEQEKCCGYPAKRMGEEGVYEDLAQQNIDRFNKSGVQTILTISPHCYNIFVNEYPEGIKNFKVQHYTEFFAEMIGRKGLHPKSSDEKVITYQDPCDLGKRQGVYDAPREILRSLKGISFVEMKRNRENSLCCGGGGGRMWVEVEEVQRLSETRVKEALALGAEIIATACPWCHIQLEDAIKTTGNERKIKVKDVAELLAESI